MRVILLMTVYTNNDDTVAALIVEEPTRDALKDCKEAFDAAEAASGVRGVKRLCLNWENTLFFNKADVYGLLSEKQEAKIQRTDTLLIVDHGNPGTSAFREDLLALDHLELEENAVVMLPDGKVYWAAATEDGVTYETQVISLDDLLHS
jgi:hypothetical protein